MKKSAIVLLVLFSVVLSACAMPKRKGAGEAQQGSFTYNAPNPIWLKPTNMELDIAYRGETSVWRYINASDGTIKLDRLNELGARSLLSEILFVGGHAVAVRGAMLPRSEPLEVVDDVMLEQQFAVKLLQQAFPQGPESIRNGKKFTVDDAGSAIGTETTNSSRYYYTPWRIRGSAALESDGRVTFRFIFSFHVDSTAGPEEKIELAGSWEQKSAPQQFPDSFSLNDWSVHQIRMGTRESGGVNVAGFVTHPDSRRYPTLGDLRATMLR